MFKKENKIPASSAPQLMLDSGIDSNLKFRVEESYKSIRTNIMLSIMKKGCKKIVVSSSVPSEGKTTTTINLAISISQADQKVLLIDADLRRPKIHHHFSISSSPGLTNYLGDSVNSAKHHNVDLFSIVHPTEFPNLSIITAGSIPPNPGEILGSEPMTDFLEEVSKQYDYIIIDTPPINVVSDALPLIKNSDGVVLIIRAYSSTHPELNKTLKSLEFINANVLGFVVNFDDSKSRSYSSKYRYDYNPSSKY